MNIADLHIHSSASDGLLSPSEIVDWGIKKNLKAISITDHDSVTGVDSAIRYSLQKDIEVISGVELSTEYENVEIHILGYFVDYNDSLFNKFLKDLKKSRKKRAEEMLKKLNAMGYEIEFDDVYEIAKGSSVIGRPHIARVLVNYGYCKSIEDAFKRLIGFGKPAYVERYKVSPFKAIELIKDSGGVSSIAHPGLIVNIDKFLLIKKLKEWGLIGVEVWHSRHSKQDVARFNSITEELNLIPTGGTDCHGVMINNEPALGSVSIPYENVLKLKEYRSKIMQTNEG